MSPGKENLDRDYRYKRSEYAACGIPEYWILDPGPGQIVVLTPVDGFYEEAIFTESARPISIVLSEFELTARQILHPDEAA